MLFRTHAIAKRALTRVCRSYHGIWLTSDTMLELTSRSVIASFKSRKGVRIIAPQFEPSQQTFDASVLWSPPPPVAASDDTSAHCGTAYDSPRFISATVWARPRLDNNCDRPLFLLQAPPAWGVAVSWNQAVRSQLLVKQLHHVPSPRGCEL